MSRNVYDMFYGASPIIHKQAKELRGRQTEPEKVLWNLLSNRKLKVKFRRQHPISQFIADFYCHEFRLIIEADGEIHQKEKHQEYDQMRDEHLRKLGVHIIRFKNAEILERPEMVIKQILAIIENLKPNL